MKKSFYKILIVALLIIIAVSLCACDLNGGNGTTDNNNGANDNLQTETKISLADAVQNYEEMEQKSTILETTASVALYANDKKYTISLVSDLTRKQDGDKVYASVTLAPNDEQEAETVGLIDAMMKVLPTVKALLSQEAREKLTKLIGDLDYVKAFLLEKIELSAEFGSYDGAYNLLANYNYGAKGEKGNVWYGADDSSLKELFDVNKETDFVLNAYLMSAFLGNINLDSSIYDKDGASIKVDAQGCAAYDISLKRSSVSGAIFSYILDFLRNTVGVIGEADINTYNNCVSIISNWLTIEKANIKGAVNKNKLPVNIDTGITVTLNININQFCDLITILYNNGVINEANAQLIKLLAKTAGNFVCGVNDETNTLKLEFELNAKEKYGYEKKDYSLTNVNEKLFTAIDVEADGRVLVSDLIKEVIQNVDEYLDVILATVDDANAISEIANAVKVKLEESGVEEITVKTIKNVIIEVLEEYEVNNSAIMSAVQALLDKLKAEDGKTE